MVWSVGCPGMEQGKNIQVPWIQQDSWIRHGLGVPVRDYKCLLAPINAGATGRLPLPS